MPSPPVPRPPPPAPRLPSPGIGIFPIRTAWRLAVTKYLIVNADDLGISIPVNLAIRRGFREGIVTSASLLANMPAFGHAVEEVIRPNPGLGVGVHLSATSGPPVLPPERVPLLVDAQGSCFRRGFVGLWRLLHSKRREAALCQIQEELAAQVERAEALGLQIDHLDGHQHVHMIPGLFDLVVGLARTRRIAVRVASEAFRLRQRGPIGVFACLANAGILKSAVLNHFARVNRRKWPNILKTDHYFGALDTGRMTLRGCGTSYGPCPRGFPKSPSTHHSPFPLWG